MANDVNKVIYGNTTVMDITDTTAEEGDVVSGKTFYKASGARSTGSAVIPDISNCYQTTDTAETDIQDADYFPFYDTSATAKRKTLWSNIKAKLKAYFDTVYATLASPAFTGTPTAPTASSGTNNTQIATTAFVNTAITGQDYKNIHYLQNFSSNISNKKVRFPWSGYSEYINPSSILIPTCEPKDNGTPYKFKSLKAFYTQDSQGNYSGYAELELVDNASAYTFNHIFELMICEYY